MSDVLRKMSTVRSLGETCKGVGVVVGRPLSGKVDRLDTCGLPGTDTGSATTGRVGWPAAMVLASPELYGGRW